MGSGERLTTGVPNVLAVIGQKQTVSGYANASLGGVNRYFLLDHSKKRETHRQEQQRLKTKGRTTGVLAVQVFTR